MKKIQIFDPALCCSTGVCGVEPDEALSAFAANFEWAKRNGATIERFNLGHQPLVFAQIPVVKAFLERSGHQALPLILIDDEVALAGRYPTKAELAQWADLPIEEVEPKAENTPCCAGNSNCC